MTQKEYTGPEYEIEFARAWYEYVKAGKVGVDPRTQWEHKSGGVPRWSDHPIAQHPGFAEGVLYRWKPQPKRTVWISYYDSKVANYVRKELVAPEVKAPPKGTTFFAAVTQVVEFRWEDDDDTLCRDWLNAGLVFLTREDAQAMADWLATCRKGGQS